MKTILLPMLLLLIAAAPAGDDRVERVRALALAAARADVNDAVQALATHEFIMTNLENVDGEAVQTSLEAFCSGRGLTGCSVRDADGEVFGEAGWFPSHPFALADTRPIVKDGEILGDVMVVMDASAVVAKTLGDVLGVKARVVDGRLVVDSVPARAARSLSPEELAAVFLAMALAIGGPIVAWRRSTVRSRRQLAERDAELHLNREIAAKAQLTTREAEARMVRVVDVLAIDEGAFRLFSGKAEELLAALRRGLVALTAGPSWAAPQLAQMMRSTHTLKSNARLFHLGRVHESARELEDALAGCMTETFPPERIKDLTACVDAIDAEVQSTRKARAKLLGEGERSARELRRANVRLQWLSSLMGRLLELLKHPVPDLTTLGNLHEEYHDATLSVGREDLRDYVERYDGMLKEMAARVGKELKPIRLLGSCRFLPFATMSRINDALLHCLRNAIAHGIEAPPKRRLLGKPVPGEITITCEVVAGLCTLVVRDDGAGMNGGMPVADAPVTDLSGRRVGLEIIRASALQLGGDARFVSAPDMGTEVHLHFPLPQGRFATRQALFSLPTVIRGVTSALSGTLERTRVEFVCAPQLESRGLIACDEILFAGALRDVVASLNAYAPKPCVIRMTLAHASTDEQCQIETLVLKIGIYDEQGVGLAAAAAPLKGRQAALGETLLECGLFLGEGGAHEIEMVMPVGVPESLCDTAVPILILGETPAATFQVFDAEARAHFGSLSLVLFGPEQRDAFLASDGGRDGIVVCDAAQLADTDVRDALLAAPDLNLVVVTPDVTHALLAPIVRMVSDPLIVTGELGGDAALQAIEFTLERRLAERRRRPVVTGSQRTGWRVSG